jgi:hypothetical protein
MNARSVAVSSTTRMNWTCTCKSIVLVKFAVRCVVILDSNRQPMPCSMSRAEDAEDAWDETMHVGRYMIMCREMLVGTILSWLMAEIIRTVDQCPTFPTSVKNVRKVFATWASWCNTWIINTIEWECLGIRLSKCFDLYWKWWPSTLVMSFWMVVLFVLIVRISLSWHETWVVQWWYMLIT